MAETDYAQGAAPVPERANISTLVNVAGAVMSLALMAGVGVWGYKLLSRDVTGVPVVRAVEGPMRIAPDDPGGRPADHQGLAVNDVAAQGSAAAPADRLVLAPQPVRLMDEDQPQTGQAPTEPTVIATSLPAPSQTPVQPSDSVTALVDQLTRGVEPLLPSADKNEEEVVARLETPTAPPPPTLTEDTASNEPEDDPATPESEPETIEVAALTGPGLARSLRPKSRPAQDGIDPVKAVLTDPATGLVDLDPDTLPAGTRLAQLGAYDSADVARSEWDRLNGRFADYMEGKRRVIQEASRGGRTFYRLRAMGFEDLSDARRFCAVLLADNADCIPVTTR